MFTITNIIIALTVTVLFGWFLPVQSLVPALQPISVALSIVVAAILVRLNRGMPSLEWKAIEPLDRIRLTKSILDLTREYVAIVAVAALLLVVIISLLAIGSVPLGSTNIWFNRSASGTVGGLSAITLLRVTYVIWRDYDIVRLQKTLIDAAASRESMSAEAELAAKKLAEMRAAGVRSVEIEQKTWPS